MKTTINYHEHQRTAEKPKLLRQLFELHLELEEQVKLHHDCDQELSAIIVSIDHLFEKLMEKK